MCMNYFGSSASLYANSGPLLPGETHPPSQSDDVVLILVQASAVCLCPGFPYASITSVRQDWKVNPEPV